MLKKDLRQKYKSLRNSLSSVYIDAQSLSIANRLLAMDIWGGTYYHLFLAMVQKKEINTAFILSVLQGKDKEVVVPKMHNGQLQHFVLTDNTQIKPNAWGVPEPVAGITVPPNKLEVVFVPLLAFDVKGNRVGYGKGYYDAFLKECKKGTLKIGLSLFKPEERITDIHDGDIPLDYCVTPDKVYSFSKGPSSKGSAKVS